MRGALLHFSARPATRTGVDDTSAGGGRAAVIGTGVAAVEAMHLSESTGSKRIVAALVCAIGLGLVAVLALNRHVQERAKTAARQELAAVAALKLHQIASWREERLDDAQFFSRAAFVSADVQRYLAAPASPEARSVIVHWLRLLKAGPRYDAVVLFDATLSPRIALPESAGLPPTRVRTLYDLARSTGGAVMGDLETDGPDGRPSLDLLFPIYADPDLRHVEPIGAVVMRLDPARHLFPLTETWPTPSRTAETLLVRRDGNDVLYLNNLRHRPGSALKFRRPLDTRGLPASRVLRGEMDMQEGVDYRGVPVVYVGNRVPGTDWMMITKVDAEELYAAARQQTLIAMLVACSFVLATLLVGHVFWQQRNRRLLAQLRVQVAALQSAANGIVITRPDGTIEWANAAFSRLTGYPLAEAVGRKPSLLRSGKQDPQAYRELWSTILAGRPWHGELVNRRKDGTLYDEELTITPVTDARGRIVHFVAIKQDVTQRKLAEEQQARTRDELEQLVAERTSLLRQSVDELEHFSYSITHDMRAPLRAMNTFAALLERKHGAELSVEAGGYVSRIQVAATRLDNLIRDSLNYSKAIRTQLPLEPVELTRLLRGMVDSYPNLQPPEAEIVIGFDSLIVLGNEAALTQCFSNLLGNAVKFVAPGVRPVVQVTAIPRSTPEGEVVRVSVHDNGIGIPEPSQQAIFGMFQRLHSHAEFPGTGIGLALVRKVVQRMGGSVGVSSTPGQGSVFWVELKPVLLHAPAAHSPG